MADRIVLNVGGKAFHTTRGTLCNAPSMLEAMFSGRHTTAEEADEAGSAGGHFIDRDPAHFPLILNYLRNGSTVLPEAPRALLEVLEEARYYCLADLTAEVEARIEELEREREAARPRKRRRTSRCGSSSPPGTASSDQGEGGDDNLGEEGEEEEDEDGRSWEARLLPLIDRFLKEGRFRTRYGESQARQGGRANLLRMGVLERRQCLRIVYESFGRDEETLAGHLNLLASDALTLHFNGFAHVPKGLPA